MTSIQRWLRQYWAQLSFVIGAICWMLSAYNTLDDRVRSLEAWRITQEHKMDILEDMKEALIALQTKMDLLLDGSLTPKETTP